MSGAELERRLSEGESQRAEFKESPRAALREGVCALANDLENSGEVGYLYVGVDDAGHLCGLNVDDALLQLLAQIRSDGALQPLPSISVERVEAGGASCAVVAVRPCEDPPMRYRGRVYVRVGSTTQIASSADERLLVERRRHSTVPFDHRAIDDATISDLAVEFFEQSYLPAAYAPENEGTNTPVRVYAFDDRIEISNPGGPFGTVSSGTFGQGGVTDYRNPILADALKTLGYAQRFGYGIPAARKALAANGNPLPRFEIERNFVNVVIEAVHA